MGLFDIFFHSSKKGQDKPIRDKIRPIAHFAGWNPP